jgi:hypothetical protein
LVDWDTIQIVDVLDDEGRVEVASEEQVYAVFGLQKEDDNEKNDMEGRGEGCSLWNECDDNHAAILVFQQLPRERRLFNRNTHVMEPESVYPSMQGFRLVIRQYAIDKEFELDTKATDKTRCRARKGYWQILMFDPKASTRLHLVLLIPKHKSIGHSSWSTLEGLLEIHLSLLALVMLARD